MPRTVFGLAGVLSIALLQSCGNADEESAGQDAALSTGGQSAKKLDPEVLCAVNQAFTLEASNRWFPIGPVCRQWVLEGEEDDELIRMEISVLDETEAMDFGEGVVVTTRVIEEREWVDGELKEVSRNFFAETEDGTVCYFGEDVDIFDEQGGVSHEGAWRADTAGNHPGIMMPAEPEPGMRFLTEGAPGTAQDVFKIIGRGRPVEVLSGELGDVDAIRVEELNPLEGGKGYKIFFAGGETAAGDLVGGIAVDEVLELVELSLDGCP